MSICPISRRPCSRIGAGGDSLAEYVDVCSELQAIEERRSGKRGHRLADGSFVSASEIDPYVWDIYRLLVGNRRTEQQISHIISIVQIQLNLDRIHNKRLDILREEATP